VGWRPYSELQRPGSGNIKVNPGKEIRDWELDVNIDFPVFANEKIPWIFLYKDSLFLYPEIL